MRVKFKNDLERKIYKLLESGSVMNVTEIGTRLRLDRLVVRTHLLSLLEAKAIFEVRQGRRSFYTIGLTLTPPTFRAEFRPLKPYDLRDFQKQCEASRNSSTGMV